MGAWDAGTIEATLRVDTAQASADLDRIEARVKALESTPHVIRVTTVFDDSSLARAKAAFATLDSQISRDALQRLRTSPYGSVLGTLDALFSPHPLAGGPSAQAAASRGLLGQMLGQQATTAVAGTQQGASPGQTLGSVVTGAATGAATAAGERVTVTGTGQQGTGGLAAAAADEKAAAAATGGAAADTRSAAADLKDAASALRTAAAAWAIGGLQKLASGPGSGASAAAAPVPGAAGAAGTDSAASAVEQLDAQLKQASADYAALVGQMSDPQQPAILSAIPQLQQLDALLAQISAAMTGPGPAGDSAIAAFQAQLRQAGAAVDAFQQQAGTLQAQLGKLDEDISVPHDLDLNDAQALASVAQVQAAVTALKAMMAGTPLAGAQAGNVTVNVAGVAQAQQQVSGLQKALAGVGAASVGAAAGSAKLGAAAKAAGSAAESGSKGFFDLTRQVGLWGGAFGSTELIGQVQLWHVLLDGLIESSVIVVETTLTMAETIVKTLPIWEQLYTNIKATDEVAHTFGMSLGPVHVGLSQLQKDLQPGVLELYGGALGLIGKQSSVAATGIQDVVSGFDAWIAKLDLFEKSQGQTGGMLVSGYNILKQLAQILDTLGVAFDNLLKADPGTVHYLLDVVEAGADLVKVFSEIPAPILKTVIGIHGFLLWGGLLADLVVKMASPLYSLALAIGGVSKASGALANVDADAGGFTRLKAMATDLSGAFGGMGTSIGTFISRLSPVGPAVTAAGTDLAEVGEEIAALGTEFEAVGADIAGIGTEIAAVGTEIAGVEAESAGFLATMGALAVNPLTWVVAAAAGVAILAVAFRNAQDATGQWITSLNTSLSKGNWFNTLNSNMQALGQVDQKVTANQKQLSQAMTASQGAVTGVATRFGGYSDTAQEAAISAGHLTQSLGELEAEQAKLTTAQKAQASFLGTLGKAYGTSLPQSMALASIAGVNLTQVTKTGSAAYEEAVQEVANLVKGWQAMSVQGGVLTSSVDAVTFAAEQQKSAVSDITGGWSAFLGVVTGGASAFITFEQGMATLTSDAGAAGASMTGVGTASVKLKSSLTTVSNASLTLQSQFQSQISSAEAVQAALLNQASAAGLGAKGTAMLEQAGKDLVAQLIPLAGGSKEATAELYAFAQLAGYGGPDSLKALTKWLGNTKDAEQNLDTITGTLTKDSSNLVTDMNNLATALQQTLSSAMSGAIFQAEGGKQAYDKFADAVKASHGNIGDLTSSASSLAGELINTLGSTKQAESQFVVFAEAMGLSQSAARELFDAVANHLAPGMGQAAAAAGAASAKIAIDFGNQAKAASSAKTTLDSYTTAVTQNGYYSSQAETARQKLIADMENAGVKAATAQSAVSAYDDAILANGTDSAQAEAARKQLITDILGASTNAAKGQKALSAYTTAVQDDGTKSDAARSARAQLIADLEKSGLNAKTATTLVDELTTAILKIPSNRTTDINVAGSGSGGVEITASGLSAAGQGNVKFTSLAAGGKITAGTTPTADDVLVRVSKDETVVSAADSKVLAPLFATLGIPGYAAGGLVGLAAGLPGVPGAAGSGADGYAETMARSATTQMIAYLKAQASAAAAGKVTGSAASVQALAKSMAAARGWTGAQWTDLNDVEMREAGWQLNAKNPSSGAYGIAQFINGPSEYAQYGGNATTAAGQVTAFLNYVAQRYGKPSAAWAHEQAYGWYDLGGWLQPGVTMAVNNTGQPEAVIPGWSMAGLFGQMGSLISSVQGLTDTLSGTSGGSASPTGTGTAYVGNYTGVVSPASGGFGLTAQQIGIAQAPATDTSSSSDTSSSDTSTASTSATSTTAAKKAKAAPNAAKNAAIAVLESLMGGYVNRNQLGAMKQAEALLKGLGITRYDSQVSEIGSLDTMLLKYRKAGNKTAEAATEKILASYGVHSWSPVLTASGNAPKAAVVKKLKSLLTADISANSMTAADQANALLKGYGTTAYTSKLAAIANLDKLLARFEKEKDSVEVKATETLLRSYGVKHFAQGGTVWEPVVGFGQRSGGVYQFAEHGPETVVPGAGGGSDMVGELRALRGQMDKLIKTTAAVPAKTGEHVGAAFGGVGQQASFARRYH